MSRSARNSKKLTKVTGSYFEFENSDVRVQDEVQSQSVSYFDCEIDITEGKEYYERPRRFSINELFDRYPPAL